MKVGSFLSPFLKSKDLKSAPMDLTISAVKAETVGQGEKAEDKLVLYFEEINQGLVLNKTNLGVLVDTFDSDETDDFVGKKITLAYDPSVRYGGKRVGGIKLTVDPKANRKK